MRIIGLEEHVVIPELLTTWAEIPGLQPTPELGFGDAPMAQQLRDTGVQLLRLVFSGVFDRHPDLQVVVGHWGEVVLFFLDHIAEMENAGLGPERPPAEHFRRNVWVTGSGLLSERYLRWTREVVGVEPMLSAPTTPYTYATGFPVRDTSKGAARRFPEQAPLNDEQRAAVGAGNWDRLTDHLATPN